jgi:lipopolysaccharide transport system permease protein
MADRDATVVNEVTIYQPGRHAAWQLGTWREMASELAKSRELIWRLFVRDFTARYSQTLLGVAWALVMPLVMVGTFVFLHRSGVLNIGELDFPYPAYALAGLTIWQIFAGGLVACSNSIVAGGSMVTKINFPKETLVIAAFGQTIVETLVRLVLVGAVFLFYGLVPPWTALLFPLTLLPLLLFTLGLGFLLSLLNAVFRDVVNVVTILTTFLLLLTPVLYPPPTSGPVFMLSGFNPLVVLVGGPRDLLLTGQLSQPMAFCLSGAGSLLLILFSWHLFHLAEMRIAERVGGR